MKIGDWIKEDINDLLDHRPVLFQDKEMHEECKECPYWKLCHGGCPLERAERNGQRVIDCHLRKALYKDYIENNDDLVKTYLEIKL